MGMRLPDPLVAHIQQISPLEAETWRVLGPLFEARRLERGEHFVGVGSVTRRFGLLESGWIRAYFTTTQGNEYNKHLFQGPAVVGDYASLLTGRAVQVPQQALTDRVVWVGDYRALVQLFDAHRDLERLARRFAELLYLEKEQRELELVTLTAKERYLLLLERWPEVEQTLAQYQIASYLGVTPTQLSRIRAQRRS